METIFNFKMIFIQQDLSYWILSDKSNDIGLKIYKLQQIEFGKNVLLSIKTDDEIINNKISVDR